jgi:hypothetical protein
VAIAKCFPELTPPYNDNAPAHHKVQNPHGAYSRCLLSITVLVWRLACAARKRLQDSLAEAKVGVIDKRENIIK